MPGVLCVWAADLPSFSKQWYEDEHIPKIMSRYSERVVLGEIMETPLDKELEGVAARDAEWESLTVFEIEDVQMITDATYDKNNLPSMDGELKGSRFDIRPYELIQSWQDDKEWDGDGADVASLLLWEWQPREGFENQVFDFFVNEAIPLFSMAPEILRIRWFKIKNATVLKQNAYSTLENKDQHTYLSIVEMNCEEWPWAEFLALNEMPRWGEYFEDQKAVMWQASQYAVTRSYPDAKVDDSDGA